MATTRKQLPAASNGRRRKPAVQTQEPQDIRAQITAEDQRPGELYTFPGTQFTVRIKPVGMNMLLMGGAVPEGYEIKKFTDTVLGRVEEMTSDYVEVLQVTVTEICKESVRLGWPDQYDDFVELMLPRLEMGHLQDLFQYLQGMAMPGQAEAIFPGPTIDDPA